MCRCDAGMDNLLVTADKAMDADSRTALEQSAAGQGVQHLVLHSADIFPVTSLGFIRGRNLL